MSLQLTFHPSVQRQVCSWVLVNYDDTSENQSMAYASGKKKEIAEKKSVCMFVMSL